MSTLGITIDRILDELGGRTDLSTQAASAIRSAVKHYERRRWWFNEVESKFVLADGQETYTASENAYIPSLITITEMRIRRADSRYQMSPRTIQWLTEVNTAPTYKGMPLDYAYHAQGIRLYPIPDALTYTVEFTAVIRLDTLSATTDTNAWVTDAEELIRYRAKWDLCLNLDHDPETAGYHKISEREAFENMLGENTRRLSSGMVRPTRF